MKYRDPNWLQTGYWECKKTASELASEAGVHKSTILDWMHRLHIQTRGKGWIKGRHHSPATILKMCKKPNLEPSPELSNLIGVIYGDGSANGRYIRLAVKDRDFAEKFGSCFVTILGKSYRVFPVKGKDLWEVCVSNKLLTEFLRDRGKHIEIIERYPADFLRGLFDSDGGPGSKNTVRLYSSDPDLLWKVKDLLSKKFSIFSTIRSKRQKGRKTLIRGRVVETTKENFQLEIARMVDVVKYARNIGFSIGRKQKKLFRVVSEIEQKPNLKAHEKERWNPNKVLDEMKKLASQIGRTPHKRDASIKLEHAARRYFGSWNNAKEVCGLEICNTAYKWKTPMIDKLVPEMHELRSRGYSYRQIGAKFGVSDSTVWTRLNGSLDEHKSQTPAGLECFR